MADSSTLVDRVKIFIESRGTGPFVLGNAVPAFRGVEALADGLTYSYAVESGSDYEAGQGVFVEAVNQLLRTPVISSNGNAPVDFPENATIAFTALASDLTSAREGTGTVTSVNASGGTTGLTFSGVPITGAGSMDLGGVLLPEHGGTGADSLAGVKDAIGLGNVDNTSDADKPVSTAMQNALDDKVGIAELASDTGEGMVGLENGVLTDALRSITPEMWGASADTADNAAAITAAASKAAEKKVPLVLSQLYPTTTTTTIPPGVEIRGTGKSVSGIISSASVAITVQGDDVEFRDMAIVSTGPLRFAVWAITGDAPSLLRCAVDGRLYFRNSVEEFKRGPRIEDCDITSDFGPDYDGVDQFDVITVHGMFGSWVVGNRFDVANVHRLVKCSDIASSVIDGKTVTKDNSRAFFFSENTVRGRGGKQVFDFYSGTSGVHITHNHFELSDEEGIAGDRWTVVIENKTAANRRDIFDIGAAMIVEGNTGYVGRAQFVALQGDYGVTQSGYLGDRYNTVKLIGNDIRRTVDSSNPLVEIRFFNEVFSDGNSWDIPKVALRAVASFLSNENLTVVPGDSYSGGCVRIGTATTNADGSTFTGKTGSVVIGAVVREFDCDGAIEGVALNADLVDIRGVRSRPANSLTRLARAAHFSGTSALARLNMTDIDAVHPSGGSVTPVLDAAAAAAVGVIKDNSWQPRFRGYVSAPPTSGTYLRGDTVRSNAPNIGLPCEWTCITGNSSGGVWRVSSYIMGTGTTAQRPALTANDAGVFYRDTTLNAGGQLISWNGTAWKDATGATV